MNKKLTKLMAALALLTFMTPSLAGWGQTKDVTQLLSEDFSAITAGNSTSTSGSSSQWSGNDNFPTVSTVYQAGGAVRVGSGSATGSITSKSLSVPAGILTVAFDVKGWSSVEGDIKITAGSQNKSVTYTSTMSGSFESKSVNFTIETAASMTVKLETTAKRAFLDNIVITSTPPSSVATPEFTVGEGTYNENQIVEITCTTDGASIYYTLDGTAPSSSSTLYEGPISITETKTLRAIAIKGQDSSLEATAIYTMKCATPQFGIPAGTYGGSQTVTITSTEGASIYYRLDNVNPTNYSTAYTEPLTISETKTVKAIAYKTGWTQSDVATAKYTILDPITTIPAIFSAATSTNNKDVYIVFDNWVVSGVSSSGKSVFVTDGTNGFEIYNYNAGLGFAAGNILSGSAVCKLQLNNSHARITNLTSETDGLTVNTGGTVTPVEIAISDLTGQNTGAVLYYDELVYTTASSNMYFSYTASDSDKLRGYGDIYSLNNFTFNTTKKYHVAGVYLQYQSYKEILPRSGADIVMAAQMTAPTFSAFAYVLGNGPDTKNIAISGSDFLGDLTVTAPSHYEVSNDGSSWGTTATYTPASNAISGTLYVRLKAGLDAGTYNETLTFTATNLTTKTTALEGTVSTTQTYAINLNQTTGGTIAADLSVAEAGATVTLYYSDLDDCYTFGGWTVLDGDAVPVNVTNNQFEMPASAVEVEGIFTLKTFTVNYSVNGDVVSGLSETINCGESASLWDEDFVTLPTGYTFAGWTTNPAYTTVVASYEPEDNVTLYAVMAKTVSGAPIENVVILDGNATGLTATQTSVTGDEVTLSENSFSYKATGVKYQAVQTGANNYFVTGASSERTILIGKSGAYLYNTTAFGEGITKFEIYSNKGGSTSVQVGINFSTSTISSYNAEADNTWTATLSTEDHVYDASTELPTGAKYFWYQITSSHNSQVQFRITYLTIGSTTEYYTLVKDVTSAETMDNIYSTYLVTVKDGGVLTVTGNESNGTSANLIIEDGGQLITSSSNVAATVKKSITGYGDDNTIKTGWNFISSPLSANVAPSAVEGLEGTQISDDPVTYNYDLYRLNNTEWENYHQHNSDATNPFNALVNGQGYLYAKSSDVTLEFAGTIKPYAANANTVTLADGWNLVGNPYTRNVYSSEAYYEITTDNNENVITAVTSASQAIAPCTGIVVKGTSSITSVAFNTSAGEWATNNNGNLQMTVAQQVVTRGESSSQTLDNAIVSFTEGNQLEKFYFGTQNANIYIPQGTEEYAIVSSEAQGEMPVSFRANENGQYTLTVNPEGVEMGYLHLIDNMTGADIDLLATPSYSFEAKTTDYESRFRLVFAANNEDGVSTGSTTFAFFSNGSWIINNEGEATLQVIDLNGRILSSETINGSVSTSLNATTGIYMMRLINGDNVKTQKVVVR